MLTVGSSARPVRASAPPDARPDVRGRRAALALFVAPAFVAPMARAGDYATDAKSVLDAQRALLRSGKGDVEAYKRTFDSFASTYKFDHKGHTNSFSQINNNDFMIRKQAEYLESNGLKWTKETSAPPSSSNKGKMLDAYIANGERCLVKEAYPPFNEVKKNPEQLAAWKAIECTQGLVKPA